MTKFELAEVLETIQQDPCPLCQKAKELEAQIRIYILPAEVLEVLKQVKKHSCEEWALRWPVDQFRTPLQRKWFRIIGKHSKCKGFFRFFGPGHEAVLTDTKKGYCQRCVWDWSHYGPQAFHTLHPEVQRKLKE